MNIEHSLFQQKTPETRKKQLFALKPFWGHGLCTINICCFCTIICTCFSNGWLIPSLSFLLAAPVRQGAETLEEVDVAAGGRSPREWWRPQVKIVDPSKVYEAGPLALGLGDF